MSSINFVSADSIEEARKERQEEWKKAYENKENPPPIQEEVPYDPRTLYERLQEQKQKKDDAFAEATKFGNLIHRIDNDEFDFLSTLENEEAQKKRELAEQEEEELKMFRMNVQMKTAPPPSQSLVSSTPLGAASGSSPSGPFSGTVAPKKKSSLFAGLVKRDNASSSKSSASDSATAKASAKSQDSTTDASKAGGKRKAVDEAAETSDNHESTESKKSKLAPSTSSPSSTKKPNALLSLVAYDSSSDEDED